MVSDSEEGRLLARAQRGDMLAFEALVQMHQQRVYSNCYRQLSNVAEAEDITAETFLRAFQHLSSLRAEPSIIYWLLRVANNLIISFLRKHGNRPTLELDEARETASSQASPEEEMLMHSRQEVVRRCLNELPPLDRSAVLMFYLEERSLEEIAAVLNVGVAGAKSRVHRARIKLRELVISELGEDIPLNNKQEGRAYDN